MKDWEEECLPRDCILEKSRPVAQGSRTPSRRLGRVGPRNLVMCLSFMTLMGQVTSTKFCFDLGGSETTHLTDGAHNDFSQPGINYAQVETARDANSLGLQDLEWEEFGALFGNLTNSRRRDA